MKITKVICQILRIESVEAKTAGTQDTIIIRVQTDEGIEGIGEAELAWVEASAVTVAACFFPTREAGAEVEGGAGGKGRSPVGGPVATVAVEGSVAGGFSDTALWPDETTVFLEGI